MIQVTFTQSTTSKASNCNSLLTSLIEAFKAMNIPAIERLIDEDVDIKNANVFGDETKWQFLTNLKRRFDFYKSCGIHKLELQIDKCDNCFKGCDVHVFKASHEKSGLPFYFGINDGELSLIKQCRFHKSNEVHES